MSRALPTIWNADGTLSQGFVDQAKMMQAEAHKLAQIAPTGNLKAITKQVKILANKGCRGCHTQYRGESHPRREQESR